MKSAPQKKFLASISLFMLASIIAAQPAKAQSIIKIDGSSTVFPITEAVSESFREKNSNVKFTIGIAGTGGGFKKFCKTSNCNTWRF